MIIRYLDPWGYNGSFKGIYKGYGSEGLGFRASTTMAFRAAQGFVDPSKQACTRPSFEM